MSLEGKYSPSTTINKCEDSVKLQESLWIDKALGLLSWVDEMNLKICQKSQATEGENSDPEVLSALHQLFGTLTFPVSSNSVEILLKTHSGLDLQCSLGLGQVDLFFL